MRLSILIPLLLILSSLASSTLLFWQDLRTANQTIQQAGIDNLNTTLTQLQNMLNTQLAADNLEDAKLSLAVSAMHPGINTLLLADESNTVLLANRYIWEGNRAAQVSGYSELIAQRVRQTQASSVSLNANLLSGYSPVTIRIVAGGLGGKRVGVLFVEYDLALQLAQARHNAVVQAFLFGSLMIAVTIAVAMLLHWLVTQRVEKIVKASKRFAAGDMDARVHLRGRDELAELGHAFDDMAIQRKQAEKELRASEQKFMQLFMQVPIPLGVVNQDGVIVYFNDRFAKVFGYTIEDMPTLKEYWQQVYPDESYRQWVMDSWGAAVNKAVKNGTDIEPAEYKVTTRNGTELIVMIGGAALGDNILATFIDITALKRTEEELHKSHEHLEELVRERTSQLEASNKELEEFSYSMSHDMRTPLRALDGFSKILLEEHGANLDDEGKRLLMVLRNNALRMGRLIDDILHFLSIGRQRMEFSSIDIAKLASEIFMDLQAATPARRLRLEIGTLPPAWGDRDMIHQVVSNLLSNAVKFSPTDAEAVIELDGAAEKDENVYSVTDHGIGFDMRYTGKLFRVFERVHPTGQYEGSGIGLALVKRILTRHGGRVWAEGKVNEGATIYFALPTKNEQPASR